MQIRKSNERGHFQNHWLNSYHTFSFSSYHDPKHMNFSLLRVLNDDIIAPKQGFGLHPHKDMEIITFMLSGTIEHRDNLGNKHQLTAGNVQLMRAGTGIVHSEINPSNVPAHLLQIWIFSDENGLKPYWEEKSFIEKKNTVLVKPIKQHKSIDVLHESLHGSALKMAQNGYVLAIHETTTLDFQSFGNSDVYIHLPDGQAMVQDGSHEFSLNAGDALYQEDMSNNITIVTKDNPLLVFVFPK